MSTAWADVELYLNRLFVPPDPALELEIDTLAGYSTIWLARALPRDGRLITLEMNATHADVARDNITRVSRQRTSHPDGRNEGV